MKETVTSTFSISCDGNRMFQRKRKGIPHGQRKWKRKPGKLCIERVIHGDVLMEYVGNMSNGVWCFREEVIQKIIFKL